MTNRERILAILNYNNYDRMPVVHFGYWKETLLKWSEEGYIAKEIAENCSDGNEWDQQLNKILGWDLCWGYGYGVFNDLKPPFECKILKEFSDGSFHVLKSDGTIVLEKPGIVSISSEIDHTLKDRSSWEECYLPRLQFNSKAIFETLKLAKKVPEPAVRDQPFSIVCGSLFGILRNWLGLEGISYLSMDNEELFDEMIDTIGNLAYENIKAILEGGYKPDYAHYWEDICFKGGPLVTPSVFDSKVGPYYKRISELLKENSVFLTSLDCDGLIDTLIPTWVNNGVNVMFPIEVGTWNASIRPWRKEYGKTIRGVGGMDKKVFAYDRKTVDMEIERLKPLVDLGGYIPCPDHRIPPDAKWDNVKYYCEKIRENF